jgi:hypothetical protein
VQPLRKAFVDPLKDAEFIADAKRSRLDTDPLTGEEIEKTRAPAVQDRARRCQPTKKDSEVIRSANRLNYTGRQKENL